MKKRFIIAASILFIPLLLGGLYITGLSMTGNFHEIVPGEFYRSAQFSRQELEQYQKRYGIRSVLNLRGEQKGMGWYDAEIAESSEDGIKHYDFEMHSEQALSDNQVKSLLAIMANAPKPLLIHCHTGANRTGLASALYLKFIKQEDHFTAGLQLSPIYGHFPVSFGNAFAMDRTYNNYHSMITLEDAMEELVFLGNF